MGQEDPTDRFDEAVDQEKIAWLSVHARVMELQGAEQIAYKGSVSPFYEYGLKKGWAA